jgi:beta-xylosidase
MNMTNAVQIKVAILSQVIDGSITTMNRTQNHAYADQQQTLQQISAVRELRFLDDNSQMKTMIGLTEFTLKEMTFGSRPTKR